MENCHENRYRHAMKILMIIALVLGLGFTASAIGSDDFATCPYDGEVAQMSNFYFFHSDTCSGGGENATTREYSHVNSRGVSHTFDKTRCGL